MKRITAILLVLLLAVSLTACNSGEENTTTAAPTVADTTAADVTTVAGDTTAEEETFAADSRWNSATYKKDTELGEGANTIKVVVKTDDHQITLTVNTDKDNLGDALFELGIINDASFFDTVNGMRLDWNTDKAYWGFYKNGGYMMCGVNDAPVVGVEQYELIYTKG